MFSNNIIKFILYLNALPKEIHEKSIIISQIFLIILEILMFFYIKYIIRK